MKNHTIALLILAIASLGGFYALARLRLETGRPDDAGLVIIQGPKKHLVTPEMLQATGRMTKQVAPSFRAEATDGKTYRLEDLTHEKPLVLAFIKDGCPCSEAAEPFFNRLFSAYRKDVRFLGVIDAASSRAKEWATENRVPFPILADPDLRIIHSYRAESSAYVALVSKDVTIEKLWPGYSAQMLNDACQRLARLCGSETKLVETSDAPAEMTTGCPY
ncbi:MAG: peroxiredoxin family protein [Isosphaeraceae bacterium]